MKLFRMNGVWGMCLGVALLVSSSGCIPLLLGAAAGAGGYAWVNGVVSKELSSSPEDVKAATLKGLDKLDMIVKEKRGDRMSTKVIALGDDGKEVKIGIKAVTERKSKITIRYGMFGDEVKSEMILNAVQSYL